MRLRTPRRLAASFILTVAAPACSGGEPPHTNPPEPPHWNPPPLETPPPSTASTTGFATPPPSASALPKASGAGHVTRRSDGTCWEHFPEHCPPDATCNPPPPEQVACP